MSAPDTAHAIFVDKRAFTLGGFIIGLLVFSMFSAFFALLAHNVGQTYGNVNQTALDRYNYTEDLVGLTRSANAETAGDDYVILGFFTKGSIATAKVLYGSTSNLGLMFRDVTQTFPEFPGWAVVTFMAIIGISLTLIIVSAIFRYPLI